MKRTPPVHLVEKPMMTPVAPMRQSMMTIPPMRPAMMTIPPIRPAMMALPPMRPAMMARTAMGRTPWCAVGIALTVLRCVLSSINLRTVSCLLVIGKGPPLLWTEAVLGVAFFHKTSSFQFIEGMVFFSFEGMHMGQRKVSTIVSSIIQFPRSFSHICLKW